MAKYTYKNGQTGLIVRVKILDKSQTDGRGLVGLSSASAGLVISTIADNEAAATAYTQAGSTIETITTLGTYAAPTATKCRFKEIDATNHPGWYELQFADARFAVSNAKVLGGCVSGAANCAETDFEIQLVSDDPYLAKPANFSSFAIDGSGRIDLGKWLGTAVDSYVSLILRTATAQGGSSNTLTLDAGASAVSNLYTGEIVVLLSGTGAKQARTITGYNGSTKKATIDRPWYTTPDATSVFAIVAADNPRLNASLQVPASSYSVTIHSGTAQAGSTATTIKLAAAASATNSLYVGDLIAIRSGTGVQQVRTIIAYNGTTKIATVDRSWVTTPDATSVYAIYASTTPSLFSDEGVAQAGGASSLTLQSTASATDDVYIGSILTILAGTDAGDTSEITDYDGTTKVATVSPAWAATPDATSVYAVIPTSALSQAGTVDANVVSYASGVDPATFVLGATASSWNTAGTIGALLNTITDLVNRLGAFTGTGINTVLGFLKGMMKKDAASTPSDVGGTYDNTTDSLEAQQEAAAAQTTTINSVQTSVTNITSGSAPVALDLTQVLGASPWNATTLGDALKASWTQGQGKWVLDSGAKTLSIYAPDGTTALAVFTLDSATSPTSRTP